MAGIRELLSTSKAGSILTADEVQAPPAPSGPRVEPLGPGDEPSAAGAGGAVTPAGPGSIGVIVTPEALLSFPVASGIALAVWKVLAGLNAPLGANLVGFVVALATGGLIYLITFDSLLSPRKQAIAFGIAVVNSFLIASSVLGFDVVADGNLTAETG
jgi:hypothetical protein